MCDAPNDDDNTHTDMTFGASACIGQLLDGSEHTHTHTLGSIGVSAESHTFSRKFSGPFAAAASSAGPPGHGKRTHELTS